MTRGRSRDLGERDVGQRRSRSRERRTCLRRTSSGSRRRRSSRRSAARDAITEMSGAIVQGIKRLAKNTAKVSDRDGASTTSLLHVIQELIRWFTILMNGFKHNR